MGNLSRVKRYRDGLRAVLSLSLSTGQGKLNNAKKNCIFGKFEPNEEGPVSPGYFDSKIDEKPFGRVND